MKIVVPLLHKSIKRDLTWRAPFGFKPNKGSSTKTTLGL
jgi:hypothetical protein